MSDPTYSIVIPICDEEQTLPELHDRLCVALDALDGSAEVILVDDGSRDMSYPIMVDLSLRDPRFKIVQLSRNFGHQIAITAGLDLACGDAVATMDGDLQHPPELIPVMARHWRDGYDVVYGIMQTRPERWFKRTSARAFYWLLARLTDIDVPMAVGDFRLVGRRPLDAFLAMRERNRYMRGMFSWIGYRQIGVPYQCQPRIAGHSKYSLARMLKLARDGVIGFSNLPLQLVLNLGFVVSGVSFLIGLTAVVVKAVGAFTVPGWASILVVVSFMSGIQLIVLGVVGEYIARIYDEVKARPLYLVRELHGFDERQASAVAEIKSGVR